MASRFAFRTYRLSQGEPAMTASTKYFFAAASVLALASGDAKKADADPLAGVWLFDAAAQGKADALARVWTSRLTIDGDRFALSKFMGVPHDLKGKLVLD